MLLHRIKKNRIKIALAVPVIFLVASSLSLVGNPDKMFLISKDNTFVEIGETVFLQVLAKADEPVNVISGSIVVPSQYTTIENISRENSIIDLWTQEPIITEDESKIFFSGGIISDSGFTGTGVLFEIVLKPTQEGTIEIYFEDSKMLAHDGTGFEVTCGDTPVTLSIRPKEHPTPDVNGDKSVNLFDFGIVSARLFMAYERPYDLNLDGKITIADIGVLIANFGK